MNSLNIFIFYNRFKIKTFVYIGISLDGFIAREDGDIDWLVKFESAEIKNSYREFFSNIDAVVLGRGTFEKVLSFPEWPYTKKVFILSTKLGQIPDNLKDKAEIVSMRPKEIINYLLGLGYTNIYVDGGKVIQAFLKEDCIDELIITRVPVLIGNGRSLFGYLASDLKFKHIQTIVYSNGLVKSQYERLHI